MRVSSLVFFSRLTFSLMILAALTFLTQAAKAQESQTKFELFAEGGLSFSNHFNAYQSEIVSFRPAEFETSETQASLRTSGRLFAGVRLWLDHDQALEASYSLAPSALATRLRCFPACPEDSIQPIPLRVNFFAGNYVHTLPSFGSLHPFLTAGAGGMFLDPRYIGIKHDPFAANLGGGVDHALTQHWLLRAEYRDWIFDMPHYVGSGGAGLVHNMVPSIGPVFRF